MKKNNNKILSVSVAAYNLENLIEQNLKSWLNKDIMDKLEILIIDDGSTDNTAKIVTKYQTKYPNTFKLIKQKNSGPGSTVNNGIKNATGKYFRMVDGDDWVKTENLKIYIEMLEANDVDMFLTKYEIYDNSTGNIIDQIGFDISPNVIYKFDDISQKIKPQMHNVTYKTNLLKKNNITVDNGFYTDMEYLLFPVKHLNTVMYLDEIIYIYRVGQATQSVSIPSMQKNINMHKIVLDKLIDYYNSNKEIISKEKKDYLIKQIVPVADTQLGTLLTFDTTKSQKQKIINYNIELKNKSSDIYKVYKRSKKMRMLLYSNYLLYRLTSSLYIKKITK